MKPESEQVVEKEDGWGGTETPIRAQIFLIISRNEYTVVWNHYIKFCSYILAHEHEY